MRSPWTDRVAVQVLDAISEHRDAEVGYDLYKQAREGSSERTQEEERRVLRRIDAFILPVFCITQGLAFLDKTALNLGNLFGMKACVFVPPYCGTLSDTPQRPTCYW